MPARHTTCNPQASKELRWKINLTPNRRALHGVNVIHFLLFKSKCQRFQSHGSRIAIEMAEFNDWSFYLWIWICIDMVLIKIDFRRSCATAMVVFYTCRTLDNARKSLQSYFMVVSSPQIDSIEFQFHLIANADNRFKCKCKCEQTFFSFLFAQFSFHIEKKLWILVAITRPIWAIVAWNY